MFFASGGSRNWLEQGRISLLLLLTQGGVASQRMEAERH